MARQRPRHHGAIPFSIVLAALLIVPPAARAAGGGDVDADLDLGAPMETGTFTVGAGGRLGWRFDLGPVWLQPEAGGHYTTFLNVGPTESSASSASSHAVRVLGGARLGGAGLISGVIEPALFGHAGYGWISSRVKGAALDVGFALDVKLVRHFSFGVQGAYNVVADQIDYIGGGSSALKWLSYGVHAGASF
jgi:hypothetical protein